MMFGCLSIKPQAKARLVSLMLAFTLGSPFHTQGQDFNPTRLDISALPPIPDAIGLAGPLVGIHNDILIVAGGANFAEPDHPELWDLPKEYHDRIWVLRKKSGEWQQLPNRLSNPIAYSSVVNTPQGVLCIGGENAEGPSNRVFLLQVEEHEGELKVIQNDLAVADLKESCTGGGAAIVGDYIYAVLGQVQQPDGAKTASREIRRLPLSALKPQAEGIIPWQRSSGLPMSSNVTGSPTGCAPKMFPLVTSQHNGLGPRLFVMGGRYFPEGSNPSDAANLVFTKDCWSFDPQKLDSQNTAVAGSASEKSNLGWKRIADAPVPISAGTAVAFGPAHIIVPAYASGDQLAKQIDSQVPMRDYPHPGFPREVLAYHAVTDSWTVLGEMPAGQVTTPSVVWDEEVILVSGEIRPRVRTPDAWRVRIISTQTNFGWVNSFVVVLYLLAMLGIGFWFAQKNHSTDDYFRGGKHIPWWVAGCSIFATMLSSITYMAVPAKSFAQDWVYALGSLMILAVAPIAIYIALPFFRRLDVTSAYEYLEKRFDRSLRLLGSGSFSLFHIFRMGVVLALAALALSSVTPWGADRCVIIMGLLSIAYCTLGGIEAVVWTDTVQTFILLGGAVLCLFFALTGAEQGSLDAAIEHGKFHFINPSFDSFSFTSMAVWVVILGGLGQNISSYTADQTVVQRYMTTVDRKQAARSIWLNAIMAVPAGIIFFGLGTAFWMFYRSHPDKLDPTMAADRIMPLFISQELPVGLAGLVVAGIFAAAQSTVSTSMNSGATTIVTDFMRPFQPARSERYWLWSARIVTVLMGITGTAVGLLFIDPAIKSLFDQFIAILGMFLGVLAGLFALGVTTRRANAKGSLIGALIAIGFMFCIVMAAKNITLLGVDFRSIFDAAGTKIYLINGYLYAAFGITICYIAGYVASLFFANPNRDLAGLTWYR